jgi:prevent-host-death family protein
MVNVKVSSAQARAKLPELVSDVAHKGSRVIIEKHGKPVAALVSIEDLERLESDHPAGKERLGALALVGAWAGVTDKQIDAMLKDIYAERRRDKGRRVELDA